MRYKKLLIIILVVLKTGCAATKSDGYSCVKSGECVLPESGSEGKALIYVVRPSSLFNNAELHNLYVLHSDGFREYIGSYSGNEYCVYRASPGYVQLMLTGGKEDSKVALNVSENYLYYVRQNVYSTLSSSKLTTRLSVVNVEEGERLLRMMTAKCKRLEKLER